jgi:hypothetical protein
LHFSYLIIKSLQKYIKSTTTSNQQSSGSVSTCESGISSGRNMA